MPRPFSNANAERMNALTQKNRTAEGLTNSEIAEYRKKEQEYGYTDPQPLVSSFRREINTYLERAGDVGQSYGDRFLAAAEAEDLARKISLITGQPENIQPRIPADLTAWLESHRDRIMALAGGNADRITRAMINRLEQENTEAARKAQQDAMRAPGAANLELAEAGEGRFLRPSANDALRYAGVQLAIGRGRRRRHTKRRASKKRRASRRR